MVGLWNDNYCVSKGNFYFIFSKIKLNIGLPTRHRLSYNNGRRVALQLKFLVGPDY